MRSSLKRLTLGTAAFLALGLAAFSALPGATPSASAQVVIGFDQYSWGAPGPFGGLVGGRVGQGTQVTTFDPFTNSRTPVGYTETHDVTFYNPNYIPGVNARAVTVRTTENTVIGPRGAVTTCTREVERYYEGTTRC